MNFQPELHQLIQLHQFHQLHQQLKLVDLEEENPKNQNVLRNQEDPEEDIKYS